ncbi:hypothetical protein HOLleu_11114 [Holothuria leucospilota]|uniref:Uncharacterized protein n=1 Tax=Holothuria leucospilota TaxID=206669 RepID=A0A9Q1CFU0_HOLLE|nr:hypothetical protein HOLleu_11114 [Holothuria leucospilota]
MPRHPAQYVTTTLDLMGKVSPRKAQAFKNVGATPGVPPLETMVMNAVSAGLSAPHTSQTRRALAAILSSLKQHKLQRQAARRFGVSTKLLSRVSDSRLEERLFQSQF